LASKPLPALAESPTVAYLSFAEQALHYFERDHDDVLREPLEAPAAWRGADLRDDDAWRIRLSETDVAELDAALACVRRSDRAMADVRAEDFPLPTLARRIEAWRRELADGRGFLLVGGLPVARWGEADAAMVFWCLGLHLGRPGAQNGAGDLLGHVTDMAEEASDPFVRRYRTAGNIAYHCDLADVVGLLCLRAAKSGGASRIVSSVAVYNELLARRPDLVERLYEPFLLDSREERSSGGAAYYPIPPCRHSGGRLRTFYHSDYFRSVVRHPDVAPFTAEELALLDLYEEIASSPSLYLDMELRPGDVQLVSNHVILHARTAYEDHEATGHKRHLLRLWLSLD
jgi:hypothetical protein